MAPQQFFKRLRQLNLLSRSNAQLNGCQYAGNLAHKKAKPQ
jgi:hypothetical protein